MKQGKVSILGAIQKGYIVLTGDTTLELNKRYITDSSSTYKGEINYGHRKYKL